MSQSPRVGTSAPPLAPIDLNIVANQPGYRLTISPEESLEDAAYRRHKDRIIFLVSLASLSCTSLAALGCAIFSSGDLQKWAMSMVSAIVGGLVGYLFGKK